MGYFLELFARAKKKFSAANLSVRPGDARKLAHEFLCQRIEMKYCSVPPNGLYGFDPKREHLFEVRHYGAAYVGGSEHVAVSKSSGAVRSFGFRGE